MNFLLDLIFVKRMFEGMPDSATYASLLVVGLFLGRLVIFRATNVMFQGGIQWSPFWIDVEYKSHKNRQAFYLLYCLLFSEAAVFLLEDYPSLVVYDHWPVINFPPEPLEDLDNWNVAFSAISLGFLMALFLVAIFSSLFLMQWTKWTWRIKVLNGTKIALFLTGCAFLTRYVLEIMIGATRFVFQNKRSVPSNKIFWIEVCDPETVETRYELCDERIFVIRVVIAWLTAGIFVLYLFLKPATYTVEYISSRMSSHKNKSGRTSTTTRTQASTSALSSRKNIDLNNNSTPAMSASPTAAAASPRNMTSAADNDDEGLATNGDKSTKKKGQTKSISFALHNNENSTTRVPPRAASTASTMANRPDNKDNKSSRDNENKTKKQQQESLESTSSKSAVAVTSGDPSGNNQGSKDQPRKATREAIPRDDEGSPLVDVPEVDTVQ